MGDGSLQPTRLTGRASGLGKGAIEAVEHALEPFEGIADELLASLSLRGLG
jgi:hypothetical protein